MAALAGAVGVLPTLVPAVVLVVLSMSAGGGLELLGGVLWGIVYPLVTGGLLLSALYYRLRGIRL
ncbi:MAG: hypothetical protein A2Y93_06825 [Chloroflexi bacterium RBG_13_68_17]|nr:MAG: hypothetical protein A2Y93_06825 [Chloroflexi bacterium RBG_13_68_17]